MKKILHLSNFNLLRLKGCFQLGFPSKISNGLTRCGYNVVNYSDRDLCRMFGFGHMNFIGRKRLNNHLINFCRMTRPDALLIGHAETIATETLAQIKEENPDIKMMQWSCDWIVPKHAQRNIDVLSSRLSVVDKTMITTGDVQQLSQFKKKEGVVAYLPNIADSSIETGKVFEQTAPEFDMFFSASSQKRQFCGEDVSVEYIINQSQEKCKDLKWFLAGISGYPFLDGVNYSDAIQKTAMGLNLSRLNDVYLYSSDRMVHMMANGQLVFTDIRSGMKDLFSDKEMVFYENEEELFEKISFYKNNPSARCKIAQQGWLKIHSEFSCQEVAQYMADILFDKEIKKNKKWQIVL